MRSKWRVHGVARLQEVHQLDTPLLLKPTVDYTQFRNWTYTGTKLRGRAQHYTFPIANEARAFARLDSIGQNGTWAVKCHGWMKIPDRQRPKHLRNEYTRWAIVKDYLPHPVRVSNVPEIRRKMDIARKALIHPGDAQPRNYRGSFLVDLGRVKTHPYPLQMWSNRERRRAFLLVRRIRKPVGGIYSGWVGCRGLAESNFQREHGTARSRKKERRGGGGDLRNPSC